MTISVQTLSGLVMMSTVLCFSAANNLNLTIHEGDDFSFSCCEKENSSIKSYVINPPNGETHPVFEGVVYEGGKISASISDKCKVKITKAGIEDNGIWKCNLFVHDEVQDSTSVIGHSISISVSVPPVKESQYTLKVFLTSTGALFCFILIAVLSVFCWRKKDGNCPCYWRNLINDQRNTGNEDNNTTRLSNQNYNIARLVYFEELKESIKKREIAKDNKNTEKHSQDYTESNLNNTFTKEKETKEDVNAAKETKLDIDVQSTPAILK